MSRLSRLFNQPVTLETYLGVTATGESFAAPVTVSCFVEGAIKLVRNMKGEEIVSSTTLYAALNTSPTVPAVAGQFAPGSRVTVNGTPAFVIVANREDAAGPARIHHTMVSLT